MKTIFSLTVLLVFSMMSHAQVQKGGDLDGEASGDRFGWAISMPDANTVAIGGDLNSGIGGNAGHVRIFSWNGNSWAQKGNDIDAEAAGDRSGISVSMPDANTVAIGATLNAGNGSNSGQVRVFVWNGNAWVQKGSDIDGESAGDFSGFSVSMPDSSTVAIGAILNDGKGSNSGHARIYRWDGSAWVQKGLDINGEGASDESGYAVSMPDSNTVAIGAPGNDGNGNGSGHVRIYRWNGSSWVQKGNDIDGEAAGDEAGYAVSMPDTNTVAIGAPDNSGSLIGAGHVRIFSWNGSAWVQKGNDIDGENAGDESGCSVSMPDANTVAVGANENDGTGTGAGHVRIYTWNGTTWLQKGNDIDGEAAADRSGWSVSMPDTSTLAIGAIANDGVNGASSGHARVFRFCPPPSMDSLSVSVCDSFTWAANNQTYTSSGFYVDTLVNAEGCDSLLVLDLTIHPSSTSFEAVSACESYTWPVNNQTYTSSGLYVDTLQSVNGCDSVLNLDLTINTGSIGADTITACDSYTWAANNQTYTSSGIYADTLVNASGCDSLATLYLTLNPSSSSFDTISACVSYTWPVNNQTYTASGTYIDTLINAIGCDSVLSLELDISPVDTAVTRSGLTLTANAVNADFQWVDCGDFFAPIPGETGSSFTVTANGSYAVIVDQNACTDTSGCIEILNVGIFEDNFGQEIALFPNPTNGRLVLQLGNEYRLIETRQRNTLGQELKRETFHSRSQIEMELVGAPGIYWLEIRADNTRKAVLKVLKE
jgi:hypothetical protein